MTSGGRYVSSYGNHSKINGCHESSRNKSPGEHSEGVKTSPLEIPPRPEEHSSSLPVCFLSKHLLDADWNHRDFVVDVCMCEAGNNPDLMSPSRVLVWITFGNKCNEFIMFSYSSSFIFRILCSQWAHGSQVASHGTVHLFLYNTEGKDRSCINSKSSQSYHLHFSKHHTASRTHKTLPDSLAVVRGKSSLQEQAHMPLIDKSHYLLSHKTMSPRRTNETMSLHI